MTQPTIVFFGPDGVRFDSNKNKIFFRALLYSTAKKGQVIESLHISIHRNESQQNFNIWVYGEKGDLKRGSGLYVPQEGVTYDHHFLLPADGANFPFLAGSYKLVVFAKLVGSSTFHELSTIDLSITESQANKLADSNTGIYFDWGPDQQSYYSHIDSKLENGKDIENIIEFLANRDRTPHY